MESQKIRQRELELRRTVFQAGSEVGIRALVELAGIERDRALKEWRAAATTEGLVKGQSRYNSMQTLIDFVKEAPREFEAPVKA